MFSQGWDMLEKMRSENTEEWQRLFEFIMSDDFDKLAEKTVKEETKIQKIIKKIDQLEIPEKEKDMMIAKLRKVTLHES